MLIIYDGVIFIVLTFILYYLCGIMVITSHYIWAAVIGIAGIDMHYRSLRTMKDDRIGIKW